jgi:hypothetical protein
MKKSRMLLFLATGMMLLLLTGGAWAYNFNDYTGHIGTYVEMFTGSKDQGQAFDIIGETKNFSTEGANLSGNTLTIFTNWNPSKDDKRPSEDPEKNFLLYTADLFIDRNLDGEFDCAVQLDTLNGKGFTYTLTSPGDYDTSQDFWSDVVKEIKPDGTKVYYSYGGMFIDTYASPHSSSFSLVPVRATVAPLIDTNFSTPVMTPVTWAKISDSSPYYSVTVDLSGLNLGNNWYFLWGTATCGNDTITGKVPEPATMLLLGLGLLGIAGARRKFSH